MKSEKNDNLATEPQARELADLPVANEQAEDARAGSGNRSDKLQTYIELKLEG